MASSSIVLHRRESVTLQLVEDESGTSVMLPDGRCIAGIVKADVSVSPGELSVLTLKIVSFHAQMSAPSRVRKINGDR